ncbi:MAG TPA: hypothetical protein VM536_18235 [Chloroflexia bacterium]|nr:hypothetical protein [Chloroflexia bacterium]
MLRALLLLCLVGGPAVLILKFYGNDVLPPVVDGVRAVIGAEAMAEVEATYYGAIETFHGGQRALGLRPAVKAPWAVPTPEPEVQGLLPEPDAGSAVPAPEPQEAAPPPQTATAAPTQPATAEPMVTTPPDPALAVIASLPSALPTLPPLPATGVPTVIFATPVPPLDLLPTAPPTLRPTLEPEPPAPEPPTLAPTMPAPRPPTAVAARPAIPRPTVAGAARGAARSATPRPAPAGVPEAALPPAGLLVPPGAKRPPSLVPLVQDGRLAGEGLWTADGLPQPPDGGPPVFWKTFLRPNPQRPDALIYLVRFDPRRVQMHIVAGTKEPVPTDGIPGAGQVAAADLPRLAAAFNGGWKSVHGDYGMKVAGRQVVTASARLDTATLAQHADGRVELASWRALRSATDLVSYRQNCPLMIDNGVVAISGHITSTWGLSLLNEMYVWRSGLAMTGDGALIYGAGTPISADELAATFLHAGARNAMQLDINSAWVNWLNYSRTPAGVLRADPLVPEMAYRRDQYLTPAERDFFYLTWGP